MNLIRKGHGHTHRGVIGVESAIVMIAFVIVAAALAFVVLNMGFSTTQKAKTTIISSLGEASSSLEVAGKVIGSGHITDAKLNVTAVPLKIASGGESVNLAAGTASVKYLSNSITYDDIYQGTLTDPGDGDGDVGNKGEWYQLRAAVDDATTAGGGQDYCTDDPYDTGNTWPNETCAFIYWTVNTAGSQNDILDQGEHAVLAIVYAKNDRPSALDTIRAEIILPTGASLTVERQVPTITTSVVDLG